MLPDLNSEELKVVEDTLENIYKKINFPNGSRLFITGTMPVALNTNNYLVLDLFSGFGLAFIFISIIMSLLFFIVSYWFDKYAAEPNTQNFCGWLSWFYGHTHKATNRHNFFDLLGYCC